MAHVSKLRLVAEPSTAKWSDRYETLARLRFKVLVLACFDTLEACACYLRVDPKTVSRWRTGARKVPGWVLMALEEKAREMRVVVAEQPIRRAA